MTLEEELRLIWAKYEPQRMLEKHAVEIHQNAARELRELNERRAKENLLPVGEWRDSNSAQMAAMQAGQFYQPSAAKTWRDKLESELLATVKRYLNPT